MRGAPCASRNGGRKGHIMSENKKSLSAAMLDRRQAIALGLGSVGALALAGCGGSGSSSSSSDSSASGSDSEQSSYKVAMIMSGIITDGGWDQGHYESLKRALLAGPTGTPASSRARLRVWGVEPMCRTSRMGSTSAW